MVNTVYVVSLFLQYFSYVMSVLYPECLVRLIMDFYSVTFDQVIILFLL